MRNKLVSRQKMSKIEVQVLSSGLETKTSGLFAMSESTDLQKFLLSFDLTSV